MKINLLDLIIILAYVVVIVSVGFIAKKRAQKNKKEYLLGGNSLPWYMLGFSNASGMFDISGTMWLVAVGFIYGLKSIWLPWMWPVFNQIFLMVFLSVWLRRSNVSTGAEWISTRFGMATGAKLSHNIVVIYALIGALGFLAYGFVGLGKFLMIFVPWETVCRLTGIAPDVINPNYVPHLYGVTFTLIATLYAILGGMVSIVWADVIQYSIMTIASVIIGIIAMNELAAHSELFRIPEGWLNPFFGWKLNLDWSHLSTEANKLIAKDGYSLFGAFMMMLIFKGILVSAAGPAPNFDMQKILAARTPKDAAKMSGSVSLILMPFRYMLIGGFVVLGVLYFERLDLIVNNNTDFEQILPSAMNEFVPNGLMGILLAGLIAAFVSTFAGTLNAAQAYIVNDLYLKYIKPDSSNKRIRNVNYIVGIGTVLISIVLGIMAENVDFVLKWITGALWGSFVASNVLKWYWWRFNGHGYFWGMVAGLIPALIFAKIIPASQLTYFFPVLLIISVIGCIAGTYSRPATDEKTLIHFYKNVRPWGFWKPIREKVMQEDPDFVSNKSFKADMFNVLIGIIWQTALVALPLFIVTLQHTAWIICLCIIILTSVILKKTWWDKLPDR